MFPGVPFNMEVRLEVDDKANSAGVVVDAIRYCKVALDRKIGGPLLAPSAWLMKHPPHPMNDDVAQAEARAWLKGSSTGAGTQQPRLMARVHISRVWVRVLRVQTVFI